MTLRLQPAFRRHSRRGRSCASGAQPSKSTPEQNARRPGPQTRWDNLLLAGDWTATGLPATIESAIRSGYRAAALVGGRMEAAA